jgi:hypothetical protein
MQYVLTYLYILEYMRAQGGDLVKIHKLLISITPSIKNRLEALRSQGYTASGYIRNLLERELKPAPTGQKGR